MRPSVLQFAPHVSDIVVTYLDAEDLRSALEARDVVVYATGADEVRALAAPGCRCLEYRHSPDPAELQRLLLPLLAQLRAIKARDGKAPNQNRVAALRTATALRAL